MDIYVDYLSKFFVASYILEILSIKSIDALNYETIG